ncbi:hypothetical protein WJX84_003867 [Apatococcus fuscideae]|uniref:Uncharacterized protein n=1 Tax=Apatococcus fuscideae TaxID=2026836 RepID=A0AAW1TC24_9CHLO
MAEHISPSSADIMTSVYADSIMRLLMPLLSNPTYAHGISRCLLTPSEGAGIRRLADEFLCQQSTQPNPTWLAATSRHSEIMDICRALLEGRLEASLALSVTGLEEATSLQQLSAMLETRWLESFGKVASRIVNAVAFALAGSDRSKMAAAALSGKHCP